MDLTLDAVYENGVFKPLKRPNLAEGQQVRLIVESPETSKVEGILSLAAGVYEGLTEEQVKEIEQIAVNRRDFFGEMAA